jgi:DNA-binding XRE family transcriptional regulator
MMLTMTNAIDFEKVELVRERMGFTIKDMSALLGVTRYTYYKWIDGGPMRETNQKKVAATLRQVLPLLKAGTWPPQGAKVMTSSQRLGSLLEILDVQE